MYKREILKDKRNWIKNGLIIMVIRTVLKRHSNFWKKPLAFVTPYQKSSFNNSLLKTFQSFSLILFLDMDQGVSGLSRSNLEAEIDKINVLTEEMMFNKKCRGNTKRSKKIDTTSITGFPFENFTGLTIVDRKYTRSICNMRWLYKRPRLQ